MNKGGEKTDKRTKTEERTGQSVDEQRALGARLDRIEKFLFSVFNYVVGSVAPFEGTESDHPTKEEFEKEFSRLVHEQGYAYVGAVPTDGYQFMDDDFIVFTRGGKKVTGASLRGLGHATELVPEGMSRESFAKQFDSISSRPVIVSGDGFDIACDEYQIKGPWVFLWEENGDYMSCVELSAIRKVEGEVQSEDQDNAEP